MFGQIERAEVPIPSIPARISISEPQNRDFLHAISQILLVISEQLEGIGQLLDDAVEELRAK